MRPLLPQTPLQPGFLTTSSSSLHSLFEQVQLYLKSPFSALKGYILPGDPPVHGLALILGCLSVQAGMNVHKGEFTIPASFWVHG
jgi:hypothetical protein